ncbi:MAG TPA: site-specific integrase, partial [Mycobacterium sp.]|nr:site-specific integrase [Mycobacterium sp.]
DLRWHDLRHSGAVLAAATGATLAELMARLGHSTPAAAMRYQHASAARGREIAALLSKLATQ